MNSFEYWRSKLPLASMGCYMRILDAVKQRRGSVTFSGCDCAEVPRIYEVLSYDHPELYWMSQSLAVAASSPIIGALFGKRSPELNLAFPPIYPASEMRAIDAAMSDARALASTLKSKNALDSIVSVLKHLAANVKYEINNELNQNAAAVFYYKKAQCSGIAKAFKYMLDVIKIPCIVVTGQADANGSVGPHAWNIVEVDGCCYHVDPTSIVGSYNGGEMLEHPLFMLSDSEISATHSWNTADTPPCPASLPAKAAYAKQRMDNWSRGAVPSAPQDFVRPVGVTVRSLVEIRSMIIQEMKDKGEARVAFFADIDATEDKLHKLVSSAAVQAVSNLNMGNLTVQVKMQQKNFNVIITKKST